MSEPFNISSIGKTLSSLNLILILPVARRDLREARNPFTIAAALLLESRLSSLR
jgi:hypothetical protein